jgi:hypothetical protein
VNALSEKLIDAISAGASASRHSFAEMDRCELGNALHLNEHFAGVLALSA